MKTIVLGDIHGRTIWKDIIESESDNLDRIIFLGDYFDSYDVGYRDQIRNFEEICELDGDVIRLIGNHDHHYFPEIGNCQTSGYQYLASRFLENSVSKYRAKLQMSYSLGDFLFSHAGISETWLKNMGFEGAFESKIISDFVNDLWLNKPLSFIFTGIECTGDDPTQTPIWIRPRSLMEDCRDTLRKKVIQVVGHTRQNGIDIKGKATGGRYYFIDALSVGEYMVIEDGKVKGGKKK